MRDDAGEKRPTLYLFDPTITALSFGIGPYGKVELSVAVKSAGYVETMEAPDEGETEPKS